MVVSFPVDPRREHWQLVLYDVEKGWVTRGGALLVYIEWVDNEVAAGRLQRLPDEVGHWESFARPVRKRRCPVVRLDEHRRTRPATRPAARPRPRRGPAA